MNIGRVLMTSNPIERAWLEDQITVNLYARRLMIGNSRVLVIDAGDDGISGYDVADFGDGLDALAVACERKGWRLIHGSALFTARDNPRKFTAK